MTNKLAIVIGLAVVGAVAADVFLADGEASLFLARKMFVLLDWLAFWR
ncbi:hypothetical protein [uncultured Pelagimonas sp.]|nr:hypothetical protein [uncultured Pelagimonas sp.]